MNNLSETQLLLIAAQAKELVLSAQKVYQTPKMAMEAFERTGESLVLSGALITGSVFIAAGRIIRLMLATEGMIQMGDQPTSTRNPNAN